MWDMILLNIKFYMENAFTVLHIQEKGDILKDIFTDKRRAKKANVYRFASAVTFPPNETFMVVVRYISVQFMYFLE